MITFNQPFYAWKKNMMGMLLVVLIFLCPFLIAATKIMPLGDSITQSDIEHASYRYWLWKMLLAAGYTDIDFVGSQTEVAGAGGQPLYPDFDKDFEAYWGQPLDVIISNAAPNIASMKPDVVLVLAGTNNIIVEPAKTVENTIGLLGALVETIRAGSPSATILLAQAPPSAYHPLNVKSYGEKVKEFAAQKNTAQSIVKAIDLYSPLTLNGDIKDGVHLTENGEKKVAKQWCDALVQVLPAPSGPTSEWTPPPRPRPSGMCDLKVTDISLEPSTATAGGEVTPAATLKNVGDAATPANGQGIFFVVSDLEKDATPCILWCDTFSRPVAPGDSAKLAVNGGDIGKSTFSFSSARYLIMAYADDVNSIAESDNDNNGFYKTFEIKNGGITAAANRPRARHPELKGNSMDIRLAGNDRTGNVFALDGRKRSGAWRGHYAFPELVLPGPRMTRNAAPGACGMYVVIPCANGLGAAAALINGMSQ